MRKLRTALLAGAGAALLAGAAVAAETYHVMNVALPDGSVAQIRYQGEVAPKVVLAADAPAEQAMLADPFAEMARISAMMELQHRQMLQQVAQMQAQMADAMKQAQSETHAVSATSGAAPANGVVQYSFVSTTSGDGCTTSVQWSSDGSGAQPKVYKTSSGECGAKPEAAKPQKTAATAVPKPAEPEKAIPGANRT